MLFRKSPLAHKKAGIFPTGKIPAHGKNAKKDKKIKIYAIG
jgi:hypothetical protein